MDHKAKHVSLGLLKYVLPAAIAAFGSYQKAKLDAEKDHEIAKLGVERVADTVNKLGANDERFGRELYEVKGQISIMANLLAAGLGKREASATAPATTGSVGTGSGFGAGASKLSPLPMIPSAKPSPPASSKLAESLRNLADDPRLKRPPSTQQIRLPPRLDDIAALK